MFLTTIIMGFIVGLLINMFVPEEKRAGAYVIFFVFLFFWVMF